MWTRDPKPDAFKRLLRHLKAIILVNALAALLLLARLFN